MKIQIPAQFNIASWLLDRPAQEYPDRIAILGEPSEVRYGELFEITNRTGNVFKKMGCAPGDRVLIALPDSVEFIASFLGAAKIGAIAVPISSSASAQEFSHYLTDCGARIAVVHAAAVPRFLLALQNNACQVLVTGSDSTIEGALQSWAIRTRGSSPILEAYPTAAGDPAFFLYTSGSTGLPKAAVHQHKNMYVTTRSFAEGVLAMEPTDRILSIPKLFFAYGLGNGMYFPLALGASTILNSGAPRLDTVSDLIARYRPTIIFAVPTFLRAWFKEMEHGLKVDLSSVRLLVYGGEPAPADLFDKYRRQFGIEMLEGFGSTEMLQTFLSNRPGAARAGTCGLPVPNYEVRLVSDEGQPVPEGEVGSLWLKGDSCFLGYWNRPDATSYTKAGEWFITGDRLSRDPDGYYRFCGRADDMIKVSGKWVSLLDVESALAQHPHIEQAVVVATGGPSSSKRLAAYIVTREGRELKSSDLRHFLGEKLPDLFVPVFFLRLTAFPLTGSGKVDRMSLPEPGPEELAAVTACGALGQGEPRSPTEKELAKIWCALLEVDSASLFDDFLDLGGTSILAMQCMSRIRQQWHVEVPLDVFLSEAASLDSLAKLVDGMRANGKNIDLDVS